jgi:mRNA interferase MazF
MPDSGIGGAGHERGEIWVVDFGSNPEHTEQAFVRSAVVVSDDRLHHPRLRMAVVVPATTSIRDIPLHVVVTPQPGNGLCERSAFQVEQVRAVSSSRMVERLGRLHAESQHAVDEILRSVLSLG